MLDAASVVLGHGLAKVFAPIGFNWQISIALVPGLAAREVAVGALGTVYALSATGEDTAQALVPLCTWGTENLAEVTRVFARRERANLATQSSARPPLPPGRAA